MKNKIYRVKLTATLDTAANAENIQRYARNYERIFELITTYNLSMKMVGSENEQIIFAQGTVESCYWQQFQDAIESANGSENSKFHASCKKIDEFTCNDFLSKP